MGRKSREKRNEKKEKLVVFVCTTNVCRSPMAEKLFQEALAKAEIEKYQGVFCRDLGDGWRSGIGKLNSGM